MIEIIIIGYGPAGISAAIYLKRNNINPMVIGKDFGALQGYDGLVENFYGVGSPISGKDLILRGLSQAKELGIDVIDDSVIALSYHEDHFKVVTPKETFETKAVLLATGKTRQTLNIPGFVKYRGKGISMCATCDGYFYRKKKIAVIGCGVYMKHELTYLKRMSTDLTVFTDGHPLDIDIDDLVVKDKIKLFKGTDKLTHIVTENGMYEVDGVFIALGFPSSLDFASQLGVIVEKGSIVVNTNYQTNIKGLFAAGDIIGGKLQIAKAVYDGMNAADSIYDFLNKK